MKEAQFKCLLNYICLQELRWLKLNDLVYIYTYIRVYHNLVTINLLRRPLHVVYIYRNAVCIEAGKDLLKVYTYVYIRRLRKDFK